MMQWLREAVNSAGISAHGGLIHRLLHYPLSPELAFSVALHTALLFGIGYSLPDPRKSSPPMPPLEVVLVNSKSKSRPVQADALAQSNLNGGGNTAADRRAKSPLPSLRDDKQFVTEQTTRRVQQLETEARRLLTQSKSPFSVTQDMSRERQSQGTTASGQDLVSRALEMARLEAEISKELDIYQKLPRRQFIGARTREYRFAQYIEDWRIKVERIGNLNYPDEARRKKIYGSLQLTVSIRSDGSVDSVEVSRSSGHRILDAAAQRIVRLASPFAPLPADIRKDTDILSITRTWTFTTSDRLESE